MKKIGIIGGLGPEATGDYYREIIRRFQQPGSEESLNYPEIIVYSVNMSKFLGYIGNNDYDNASAYLGQCIESLEKAGADFAAISANTPHILFDRLQEQAGIPLISIVETTFAECQRKGLKRPGLFGTRFTMEASFYPDRFKKQDIDIIIPPKEDIDHIHFRLFSEIELGIFKDETRDELIGIIGKMIRDRHIDSLILGCTEFPLILTEPNYAGIPMLNTTQIHVDAIVRHYRS